MDIELGTWKMYFDGVVNQHGNGIGILLITPEGSHIPLAINLNFEATKKTWLNMRLVLPGWKLFEN